MTLEYRQFNQGDNAETCFLWLHGYGANMDDLVALKDVIQVPMDCDWFFLNGPLSIPISFFMEGRAWFPLDMNRLEVASLAGNTAEVFANSTPPGYLEAVDKVVDFIQEELYGYKQILIGGFSQGSMVANRIALRNDKIKMQVLFSTTYFDHPGWQTFEVTNKNLVGFQSHGKQDMVLPVDAARKMDAYLKNNVSEHMAIEFDGGHEIPPVVIQTLNHKISEWHSAGKF